MTNHPPASGLQSTSKDMPLMESIASVVGLPVDTSNNGGKWKRLTRDFRFVEFAISIVMYGLALFFAKVQVAQRTLIVACLRTFLECKAIDVA